ncbi:hypothetical protein GMD78_12310 [Ornithinibacillus sp. L9]|uniref:Uncharacterized protein n=1 Tax=Ornithinibacillus caprae TaxID=2678566 RepID=A0A6N8FKB6_9BACI|nr:hypothetical protein [Ornithinibacillus caprae]MUK89156.1 hypothetical protein [Ornithinibacillus caprae]
MDQKEYVFGLADITIGEGEDVIKFDGKDYLQAEGGELTLTPLFADITFQDFGDTIVERRLTGWEGQLTIVVGQESADILELALGVTENITDATSSEVVGHMDGKIGTKVKGRKVNIHPRVLPVEEKSQDFNIYNMASIGGVTRGYANEQGNFPLTLTMMPREGFDASKPGNFFYRGGTDPNAV